jgi:Nuclease-related domain
MARPKPRSPRSILRFGHHRGGATPAREAAHEAAHEAARDGAAGGGAEANGGTARAAGAGGAAEANGGTARAGGAAEANGGTARPGGAAEANGGTARAGGAAEANGGTARAGGAAEANGGTAASGSAEAVGGTGADDATPEDPRAWPNANGAATASPAAAPEAAKDPADVPIWGWAAAEESGEPGEAGHGLPRDVLGGEADAGAGSARSAGSVDSRHSPEPVVTPVVAVGDEPRREGIGQHLGNLAHLSADPRKRAWQRRAIIAIVVGVVFSIVVSWRLGLTLAVLAAIADAIYRSRTTFTGQGEAQLNAAQRRTRRQLGRMAHSGYRAMDNVPIPGTHDQIDHLVIGRAGVFSIDSEAWDRRLPLRPRLGRELWHGPYNMQDRLEHARWESERAAELLSRTLGSQVTVRPAMAVYGPKMAWQMVTIGDVDVFRGPHLRKYLRGRARQNRGRLLSASDIERIDKAAHEAFARSPLADPPSR